MAPALATRLVAEARAAVNASSKAGADTFASAVAPAIREAQAAGAKSLREIAAVERSRRLGDGRRRWRIFSVVQDERNKRRRLKETGKSAGGQVTKPTKRA